MWNKFKDWWYKITTRPVPVLVQAPPIEIEEVQVGRELIEADDAGHLKLGVIVGHTKIAPGAKLAAPHNLHEYQYNTMVAKKMVSKAPKNIKVEVIYRDGVGISGAYLRARQLKCDCVIELHFNAFNTKASGTETLCTPDASDVAFAHTIQKLMCSVFQRNGASRGVKTLSKSARGGGNVHSFPGGVNCLVEPFFGDNPSEAKMAMELSDAYAEALIQGVALWGKQVDLLR